MHPNRQKQIVHEFNGATEDSTAHAAVRLFWKERQEAAFFGQPHEGWELDTFLRWLEVDPEHDPKLEAFIEEYRGFIDGLSAEEVGGDYRSILTEIYQAARGELKSE